MPAEAARDVVAKNRKVLSWRHGRGGLFSLPEAVFRKVFGDLIVREAAKPLLIPRHGHGRAVRLLLRRHRRGRGVRLPALAGLRGRVRVGAAEVASLDGRTRLRAAAAADGTALAWPTRPLAVTHVLHNKREFRWRVVLQPSAYRRRVPGRHGGPSRINGVRKEQSNQLHPHPDESFQIQQRGGNICSMKFLQLIGRSSAWLRHDQCTCM